MKILTLDVSTTCTGWAIFEDKKREKSGSWRTATSKKLSDTYDKLRVIEENLKEIKKEQRIERILIEAPLLLFNSKKGRKGSSPQTLATLQKYNGAVSFICHQIFDVKPEHISFKSCRSNCRIIVGKGEDAKKKVMEWAIKNVPGFQTRITNQGNIAQECYDEADALVLGYGFFS